MPIQKLEIRLGDNCGYRYIGDEDNGGRKFLQFEVWGSTIPDTMHAAAMAAMQTGNQGKYSTRGLRTQDGKTFSLALVEVTNASADQ